MNTWTYTDNESNTGLTSIKKVFLTGLLLATAVSVQADGYQDKVLFQPSVNILMAEAHGRIMIYDGVKSESVDRAMDEQFDRIQTMMFVNTLYQQEDGEYKVENDDCD